MSVDFRPLTPIRMADLFDGRLENVGVREHHNRSEYAPRNGRCLTDGENFLWVFGDESVGFCAYVAGGYPSRILVAIQAAFNVYIVSEHDPKFWGFETEEEWRAAWAQEKAGSGAHGDGAHDDEMPF